MREDEGLRCAPLFTGQSCDISHLHSVLWSRFVLYTQIRWLNFLLDRSSYTVNSWTLVCNSSKMAFCVSQAHTAVSATSMRHMDQRHWIFPDRDTELSFSLTSEFANFTGRSSNRFLKDFVAGLSSPVFLLIITFVSL